MLSQPASARQAAVLAALVVVLGAASLTRPGYSVDEEFTVFAVRGIDAHGLPLLPSQLLYDRGLSYSYATWAGARALGAQGAHDQRSILLAGRTVSLLSGALAIVLAFLVVRRVSDLSTGLVAAVLAATSFAFWATATTARFYAPFFLIYLAFLYCLTHRHYWLPIMVLGAAARLTHELGFTLAAVPLGCVLVATGQRKHWLKVTAATVAGLVAGQLLLLALHYAAPSSGDTMVRRFFLWQVLNLFERPGDRQFLIPIVAMVIGWLVAPRRSRLNTVVALSIAAMVLAYSIARATNAAPLSWPLVQSVLLDGSRYPLDMFWHLVRLMPITVGTALLFIAYRSARDWPASHRAAHALWIGWVLWFGVIESGITTNYLLIPVSLLLLSVAIDAGATGLPRVALAALLVIVGAEQWRAMPMDAARPTIVSGGIDDIRAELQPTDRVVCTDELGCLMLAGRIDRWLALDDYVRERFLVRRGDGPLTGVYTGVPAAFRPADLFAPNADGSLPERVLIFDIYKEYPIGNSRSWLPKAIEEDGLQVVPLLETPQLRVIQVSPPERAASFR